MNITCRLASNTGYSPAKFATFLVSKSLRPLLAAYSAPANDIGRGRHFSEFEVACLLFTAETQAGCPVMIDKAIIQPKLLDHTLIAAERDTLAQGVACYIKCPSGDEGGTLVSTARVILDRMFQAGDHREPKSGLTQEEWIRRERLRRKAVVAAGLLDAWRATVKNSKLAAAGNN